jgi:hypothetical protein
MTRPGTRSPGGPAASLQLGPPHEVCHVAWPSVVRAVDVVYSVRDGLSRAATGGALPCSVALRHGRVDQQADHPRLGQILAVAEERDLIPRNPVRVNTRNRRLKAKRKRPVYLESADEILGTTSPDDPSGGGDNHSTGNDETPADARLQTMGAAGFEPATSRV